LETGILLVIFQGHTSSVNSAVFSPDGRRVLTVAADTTARLWEAETRIPIVPSKLLASFQHTDVVNNAIFSPDGQRVSTASRDKTARLWEVEGGKLLATFEGHTEAVNSAVFSVDGRRVLTASEDGTARLWPLLPDDIPIPEWFGDFLVWLGGKRIAPNGQIETLSGDELGKLEATFGRTGRGYRLRQATALEAIKGGRSTGRSLRHNHARAGG
jgi:WD40 repeat protein